MDDRRTWRPSIRQVEPIIPVVLGLHGALSCFADRAPTWPLPVFGLVIALGVAGLLGWTPAWARTLRAGACLLTPLVLSVVEPVLVPSLLQWYYCAVAVYALVLPRRLGAVLGPLAGACYLVQVASGAAVVPWGVAVLRAGVLTSLGLVMWRAGNAYRASLLAAQHGRLAAESAQRDLEHAATHDDLTGLANRTLFHRALRGLLATGQPVGVLLLDLDGFKDVNDTLGHRAGDALLAQVGGRLRSVVRPQDTVARLGGDEFAVCLAGADGLLCEALAMALREALQEPFVVDDALMAIDASIGIALAPEHAVDDDRLLQLADVAMYAAKRSGEGSSVYDAANDTHTADRLVLLAELRGAIPRGEVVVEYQPQVDTATGRPVGLEALARWDHPTRGRIGPDVFIPLAERSGMISALSAFVLDAALEQCRRWRDAGLPLWVSVNLSARDLQQEDLPQQVALVLDRHGLPADVLELEITETQLMADPERAQRLLAELHELGVSLAIDDFGTGMSSLAYLRDLPVQVLKIDKTFITHLADEDTDALIVGGVIDLATRMGLRTVAEGVEDEEVHDRLVGMGCTLAQGFLFSRAMPSGQVESWCRAAGAVVPRPRAR